MIQVDLEQPLPFPDRSFDVVMLLFVMNHIWNVANLLKEIRRVCRGHVLLGTSFVHQYTPEPCDFSRFTEEGLARLYREAGFADFRIFPIGHGPCTLALAALQQTAHCAASATLLYPVIWAGDTALTRLLPRRAAKRSIMTHLSVLQADT